MPDKIEIDSMKAGPELNALTAEHVMQFKVKWEKRPMYAQTNKVPFVYVHFPGSVGDGRHGWHWIECPKYSQFIDCAWLVVEKMRTESWIFEIKQDYLKQVNYKRLWECNFGEVCAIGTSAEEAICKAALKAVTDA